MWKKRFGPLLFVALMVSASVPVMAHASRLSTEDRRMKTAEQVLKMSLSAPDKGIPRDLVEKAQCIGIFPGVKKAAFIVGGELGRGVFTCRESDGTMSAPAFFTIGGGSVGWQWGGQSADLVLLVMNEDGFSHLMKDHFTLGAEAAIAAGPLGRNAQASTDAQLHAEILSWSRTRGVYLGAALKGAVIKPDRKANQRVYDSESVGDLLHGHASSIPQQAQSFMKVTNSIIGRS